MFSDIRKSTDPYEGSQASPACPYQTNIKIKLSSMEHWWDNPEREKLKSSDKNLPRCRHFVHHKSQMDWPGFKSGPPR